MKIKQIIALGMIGIVFTGCGFNTQSIVEGYSGVGTYVQSEYENYYVKTNHLREKDFMELDEEKLNFINNEQLASGNTSIDIGRTTATMTLYKGRDTELAEKSSNVTTSQSNKIEDVIDRLDKQFVPGIKDFVEDAEKNKGDMTFKSNIQDNIVVTVAPIDRWEQYTITVEMGMVKLINAYHQSLIEKINTKDFMFLGPYVGETKEVLELVSPGYLSDTVRFGAYENDIYISKQIKQPNAVAYQLYTEKDKLESARVVVDKEKGIKVDKAYFEPFYNITKELGVELEGEAEIAQMMEWIEQDKLGEKTGKLGKYTYTYNNKKHIERIDNKDYTYHTIEIYIQ